MVLLPMNARRCEEPNVARVLNPIEATSELVREAVFTVFADPSYREAAEHMRDEIVTLSDQMHAVILLERLAAERAPVLAR
jgi:UDP:flavonoid glycosyltransferase YjiC (YdhE family)